jgi:hypothetical protein
MRAKETTTIKHKQNTIQSILCKGSSNNNITINSLIKIKVIVTRKKHIHNGYANIIQREKMCIQAYIYRYVAYN